MRLIDADKAIGHIKTRLLETAVNNADVTCDASFLYTEIADNRIETWINETPTVDAVPVVRCKDCKWYARKDKRRFVRGSDCTRLHGMETVNPDSFCSYGERKG